MEPHKELEPLNIKLDLAKLMTTEIVTAEAPAADSLIVGIKLCLTLKEKQLASKTFFLIMMLMKMNYLTKCLMLKLSKSNNQRPACYARNPSQCWVNIIIVIDVEKLFVISVLATIADYRS